MREELLRVASELAADRAPTDDSLPVEPATACAVSVIVQTISWWLRQPREAYSFDSAARILHRLLGSSMLESGADT